MDCHTPMEKGRLVKSCLGAGGRVFKGPLGGSLARNLTPHDSGLKSWTDAEIARAIREGVRKDGSAMKSPLIIPTRFPDMGSLEWTEAHLCADRDPTHARSAYIDLPIPGCPAD